MMAELSGVRDPKISIFSVQIGGDLITHKVIKSIVYTVLCPLMGCMRNLQRHSWCLGLSAQGAFPSHSFQPK